METYTSINRNTIQTVLNFGFKQTDPARTDEVEGARHCHCKKRCERVSHTGFTMGFVKSSFFNAKNFFTRLREELSTITSAEYAH